ncbi:MAG: hypothetical protein ABI852_08375 [Gemmatimonadaceae bacterium]
MRHLAAITFGLLAGTPLAAQTLAATDSSSLRAFQLGMMATTVVTRAAPAYDGRTFTELQLVQPNLSIAMTKRGFSFWGVLNAEGYTLKRGELNAGIAGEGYVDRRHPHTLVHEAMLVWQPFRVSTSPQTTFAVSAAAGKGFVPFGSDDPMMRPLEKYPVNHHHAQIIERIQTVITGRISRGARFVAIEGASFNGDEPAGPFHGPRWERFGDSWTFRATAQPLRGVELSASRANVRSPELQQGGAFDHHQHHASLRIDRPASTNGAMRYVLAEWARTDEITNGKTAFRYGSALIEGAYGWRGVQTAVRVEQTDRGEQMRLLDPFRAPLGHVDFQNLGVTRWQVTTVALSAPNMKWRSVFDKVRVAPFVELARAAPTPRRRPTVFEPADFYGASTLWSLSLGFRLHAGSMRLRMGRYGVMSDQPMNEKMHHAM